MGGTVDSDVPISKELMFPYIPDIVITLFAWEFQFAGKAMLNIYFIDAPKKEQETQKREHIQTRKAVL